MLSLLFGSVLTLPGTVMAGLASQWYLSFQSIQGMDGQTSFPYQVMSFDPGTGAISTELTPTDSAPISGLSVAEADASYFVLQHHVDLGSGLVARPNDIIVSDASGLNLAFDADTEGIPDGVKIDALHRVESGQWVISIDVHAELGGTTYSDGDLIGHDGTEFFLVASEADLGLENSADVTGITQGTGGRWLVTLASGGQTLDGMVYFSGDVLLGDSDGRLSAIELSSREAPLSVTAGLNAISAEPAPDEMFSDRFQE